MIPKDIIKLILNKINYIFSSLKTSIKVNNLSKNKINKVSILITYGSILKLAI